MQWGLPHSLGHYVDFGSAVLTLALFPVDICLMRFQLYGSDLPDFAIDPVTAITTRCRNLSRPARPSRKANPVQSGYTPMSCSSHSDLTVETEAQQRVLRIALALNATMFIVGLIAGLLGQSSSLIADALDMLADAFAYAIALGAVGRSARFKAGTATLSGSLLLLLGVMVLLDVGRRALLGSEPESAVMMAVAFVSLLVNATVLRMLRRYREGEVHLRATWIFTRVDVIANIGVILSGLLILLTGSRFPDLVVGGAIGVYVVKEAIEILSEAREARAGEERDE
jgi:Co/Zn/Cd efflux system component